MDSISIMDLATVSAVVAALVTVVGNAFNIDKKYRALLAIGVACILWFIPSEWGNEVLVALVIGLTASGVYSQVKPRDNQNELLRMQMREEMREEQERNPNHMNPNPNYINNNLPNNNNQRQNPNQSQNINQNQGQNVNRNNNQDIDTPY
ncbi:hypothetical protein [Alkalihalobacterium elongatum]|uniref:hypothetical protein n=1 Tax=Alkalihalobacterium elongatum TaxID=2675466 RepID=UPI001C1FD367|nr:hypothetical protein [Alkalihalobacterium elongatum]